jgi:hypothetical protein
VEFVRVFINKENIKLFGRIKYIIKNVNGKIIYKSDWIKNIIPTVGKTAILRRLGNIGSLANEGMITYGAVGGGTSVHLSSNTILYSELGRATIASSAVAAGVLSIESFFNSATGNGSLTQFALFGEAASGTINTGTMFQYVNFASTITKTSAETLTVISEITFT